MFEDDFSILPWPAFFVRVIKNIYRFIGLFLIIFIDSGDDPMPLWAKFAAVAIILGLMIGPALIGHFTFKLKVTDERLLVKQGVINRRELDIPYSRIQAVSEKQWFFFAPFNLTQLNVETAAGDSSKAEVELLAIPITLAKLIEQRRQEASNPQQVASNTHDSSEATRVAPDEATAASSDALLASAQEQPDSSAQIEPLPVAVEPPLPVPPTPSYQISLKQIALFSLTDLSMLFTFVILFEFLERYLDKVLDQFIAQADQLVKTSAFVLVAFIGIVLVVILICSFIKSFYKYHRFEVFKSAKELTIEQGLLARNRITIPYNKIQGVQIKQSLLRKIFKLSSVKLILATGNSDKDQQSIYLLPIINDGELLAVLQNLMPAWDFGTLTYTQNAHARIWYFIRWRLGFGLVACGVAFYFKPLIGALLAVVVVLLILSGIWESRVQGYQIINERLLSVQTVAIITRTQSFLVRSKVQALECQSSLWLAKKKLGSVALTVKAGDTSFESQLNFVPVSFQTAIRKWYLAK